VGCARRIGKIRRRRKHRSYIASPTQTINKELVEDGSEVIEDEITEPVG